MTEKFQVVFLNRIIGYADSCWNYLIANNKEYKVRYDNFVGAKGYIGPTGDSVIVNFTTGFITSYANVDQQQKQIESKDLITAIGNCESILRVNQHDS